MKHLDQFYIDGGWVAPSGKRFGDVVDPSTEAVIAKVPLGESADVDRAVAVARRAFESFSQVSREDRIAGPYSGSPRRPQSGR